jgi:hypothetical protein
MRQCKEPAPLLRRFTTNTPSIKGEVIVELYRKEIENDHHTTERTKLYKRESTAVSRTPDLPYPHLAFQFCPRARFFAFPFAQDDD